MPTLRFGLSLSFALFLAACVDREAQQRAAAERAAAQAEAAAQQGARQVAELLASGQVEIAHGYAQDVVQRYPNTQAGRTLTAKLPALASEAKRVGEQRRLRELWTYHAVDDAETKGVVYTAYIHAVADDAHGSAPDLRLVLRRHPAWGQSVYLLMEGGDFACQDECRVPMGVDQAPPKPVLVSRAKGNKPPALFIEDDRSALAATVSAQTLSLELPLLDGSTRRYRFEVGGLDAEQLGPPPKP